MLEKLRIIFTIPELRQKILLTIFLLAIYRVGWQIPLPIINQEEVAAAASNMDSTVANFLQKVAIFSASSLTSATIFGLGIMPYISASIILQLLGTVYKPLEELKKEGEAGQRRLTEYTRYLTVVLCLIQSTGYLWFIMGSSGDGPSMIAPEFMNANNQLTFFWGLTSVLIMTCGSVFLMWLGEQIDEYGIGNGISLLIMAGIVAQMPPALNGFLGNATLSLQGTSGGNVGLEKIIMLAAMFIAVVVGVVFITLAQRRIPTQSAKHVRGASVSVASIDDLQLDLHWDDLLLLLLLDCDHLQSERDQRQHEGFGNIHPRSSSRPSYRRVHQRRDGAYHLRWCGFLGIDCDCADADLDHDGRRLHGRKFLRWYWPSDRRQRGV